MSRSLRGRGLLAKRVSDILVVGGPRLSRLHLPSSSPSSSQCLLHPPPPSFHYPARQYSLHRALPHQACFLNSASLSCPLHSSASLLIPPSLSPSFSSIPLPSAWFSTSPLTLKTRPKVEGGPPQNKRKEDKSPFITLIDAGDKVSSMSLDQAERLAKRRDLKLVKIEDPSMTKGSLVYRLLTGKQYFEEQVKAKRSEKKSTTGVKDEKILAVGGKITPHDLAFKLHSVTKWLSKGHQIKVTISSRKATKEEMENVFSTIEEEVKKVKGRILQRHEKMEDIRFYIAPPKDRESVTNSETTQGDDHAQSYESNDHTKG